jgi:hypothetical protein
MGQPNDSCKWFVGGRVNISRVSVTASDFANGGIVGKKDDSDQDTLASEELAREDFSLKLNEPQKLLVARVRG